MKTPCLLFLMILFLSGNLYAQTGISGRIITGNNKPVPLASVALFRDTVFVTGAVTDDSGFFKLLTSVQKTGYILKVSITGYTSFSKNFIYPDTSFMASISLAESKNVLKEVTVTSTKPLVTRKADRYIVNVENSFLAVGNSGLDVLQKSPGLWVSPNGSIRINGSQSVTVMINDVVQRMSEIELADYLRSLKSEDISKIEIIPNPPAEYEASSSGGIVHIILKKARKEGLTGSIYSQYKQQGSNPYISEGISFDLKARKLYFFGGYNYTKERSRYTGYNNVQYADGSMLYNTSWRYNNNTRDQYRFGTAYDFSKTQSLTLQTNGTGNTLLQHFYSDINYTQPNKLTTGNANTQWDRVPKLNSTTANYLWKTDTIGSSLKVIGDYTKSTKQESNTLASVYSDTTQNSTRRTNTPSSTNIYSIQADYTKAMSVKSTVRTGAKYVYTKRDNTILSEDYNGTDWIKNIAGSNNFVYNEKLLMFYASFERSFDKTSIKGGLRGEQTYSHGYSVTSNESIDKDYFGLFPSLFIDHVLNEKKGYSIHLNYSRRVKRPAYNDLNPYRLQVNDFTILTGNPDLLPQYTHNIQAGITLLHNFSADVFTSFTSNFIAQTATTFSGNVVEYKSKNYPGNTEYGLTLNAPFTIVKGWSMNNNVLFYYTHANLDTQQVTQTSFSLKCMNSISLKNIVDIDVYMEYNSPYTTANMRMAGYFYSQFGFTKRVLKNKGRLRFTAEDPFNACREKELTIYNGTRIDFYQKRPTRTFSLAFTYNFSLGKEFTKKKIDQNNSDEKSRAM